LDAEEVRGELVDFAVAVAWRGGCQLWPVLAIGLVERAWARCCRKVRASGCTVIQELGFNGAPDRNPGKVSVFEENEYRWKVKFQWSPR